jgi:hypothetical protein
MSMALAVDDFVLDPKPFNPVDDEEEAVFFFLLFFFDANNEVVVDADDVDGEEVAIVVKHLFGIVNA